MFLRLHHEITGMRIGGGKWHSSHDPAVKGRHRYLACNGQNRVRDQLENGFPRTGVATPPLADLTGDSDKMRQGRVAFVPHAKRWRK
jgi:hypothetical protein